MHNKYYKYRRYITLYNTMKMIDDTYISVDPNYATWYVDEFFSQRYDKCIRTLRNYNELLKDDPIIEKMKHKNYFSLYLYKLLRAVIVDGDYEHETTAIDQMDSVLDT